MSQHLRRSKVRKKHIASPYITSLKPQQRTPLFTPRATSQTTNLLLTIVKRMFVERELPNSLYSLSLRRRLSQLSGLVRHHQTATRPLHFTNEHPSIWRASGICSLQTAADTSRRRSPCTSLQKARARSTSSTCWRRTRRPSSASDPTTSSASGLMSLIVSLSPTPRVSPSPCAPRV